MIMSQPLLLKESTSQHINIPQCAAAAHTTNEFCRAEFQIIAPKEAMDVDDNKEELEQLSNSQSRSQKYHHSSDTECKEIMSHSAPSPDSMDELEASNHEMLKHYADSNTCASPDFSNASPEVEKENIAQPLSYDDITEMMGADTFCSEFADNLFREEGGCAQPWYSARTRMPAGRKEMIDWIRTTSYKYQFADTTQFRAMFYLDKLCSIKNVVSKNLRITAAVCLYISAKYNEVDAVVPRLGRFCGRHLDADIFIQSERSIANAFGFQFKAVLPIDFVLHWIDHQRVVFADDLIANQRALANSQRQCAKSLERFSVFFLNMAASDPAFWAYPASVMAASVLCAARRVLRIAPYWNPKLTKTVRNDPKGLEQCFSALWREYAQRFPGKCETYTAMQPRTMAQFSE